LGNLGPVITAKEDTTCIGKLLIYGSWQGKPEGRYSMAILSSFKNVSLTGVNSLISIPCQLAIVLCLNTVYYNNY